MATFSSQPTASDLFKAIITNSASLVKSYLDAGLDPNVSFASAGCIPLFDRDVPKNVKVMRRTQTGLPTALHVAVINCYHNYSIYMGLQGYEVKSSLGILEELLNRGADTTAQCYDLILTNIEEWKYRSFDSSSNRTPIGLAVFLKEFLHKIYEASQAETLDAAIQRLETASRAGQRRLPTVPVLKSCVDTYKSLYLSEDFSDIKFVCPDGTVLHAHRCILAAASSYFKTALSGPWAENNATGEWQTSHSSHIIKAVLALIYRGKICTELLEKEPLALLVVACEYELESFKTLAVNSCIRSLKSDTVKEMLQTAHLYHNTLLKEACFDYVRRNAAKVLTNPDMIGLTTEDPALWSELTNAIAPTEKENASNKRARTS